MKKLFLVCLLVLSFVYATYLSWTFGREYQYKDTNRWVTHRVLPFLNALNTPYEFSIYYADEGYGMGRGIRAKRVIPMRLGHNKNLFHDFMSGNTIPVSQFSDE